MIHDASARASACMCVCVCLFFPNLSIQFLSVFFFELVFLCFVACVCCFHFHRTKLFIGALKNAISTIYVKSNSHLFFSSLMCDSLISFCYTYSTFHSLLSIQSISIRVMLNEIIFHFTLRFYLCVNRTSLLWEKTIQK